MVQLKKMLKLFHINLFGIMPCIYNVKDNSE